MANAVKARKITNQVDLSVKRLARAGMRGMLCVRVGNRGREPGEIQVLGKLSVDTDACCCKTVRGATLAA